jgi:AraC family transcriptional regulator
MNVELRDFAGVRLAGRRHIGPYMAIGKSFEQLFAWAGPRGLVGPATRCLAIYHDNPADVPADRLRSDACLSISAGVEAEQPYAIIDLAPARCAVVRHKGPYEQLHSVYEHLYTRWLPTSGRMPAMRPPFEEYLNNPQQVASADLLTDVFVPLA